MGGFVRCVAWPSAAGKRFRVSARSFFECVAPVARDGIARPRVVFGISCARGFAPDERNESDVKGPVPDRRRFTLQQRWPFDPVYTTAVDVSVNDSAGRAPHLRVRLVGTGLETGGVHMCAPSDGFPFAQEDLRSGIRPRDADKSQEQAREDAVRR